MSTNNIEIKELTDEDLSEMEMEYYRKAMLLGYSSYDALSFFGYEAAQGMIKFGGSFAHALGMALAHADPINTMKIVKAFNYTCQEHAELYREWFKNRSKKEGANDEW